MMLTPICPRSLCPLKTALDYSTACPRSDCPLKPQPAAQRERDGEIELVDHHRVDVLRSVR